MTGFFWLLKLMASFQASVPHLNDLMGQRNVCPNQNIDIMRR
jgi:hypothetical protein